MRRVELYDDPRIYDVLRPRVENWDGPFFLELAQQSGGRVLELACGNGRVLHYLHEQNPGLELTGLDLAETMLADGRARVPEARFVQGDMRTFELDEEFDLILLPLNSLLHLLTTDDLVAALENVRRHLADDGRFAFNVFHPNLAFLSRDHEKQWPLAEKKDRETGKSIIITEQTRFDRATQILTTTWFYAFEGDDETLVHDIVTRVIYPEELLLLLRTAGLAVEHRYGDLRRWPFDDDAEHQVIVAKKPA